MVDDDVVGGRPCEEVVSSLLDVGVLYIVLDGRGNDRVVDVLLTILGVQENVVDEEEEAQVAYPGALWHPTRKGQEA